MAVTRQALTPRSKVKGQGHIVIRTITVAWLFWQYAQIHTYLHPFYSPLDFVQDYQVSRYQNQSGFY